VVPSAPSRGASRRKVGAKTKGGKNKRGTGGIERQGSRVGKRGGLGLIFSKVCGAVEGYDQIRKEGGSEWAAVWGAGG